MVACIPAIPDVAGQGVRYALYIQNFLGFVPATAALWDRTVDRTELLSLETQSVTVLIMAIAILVSAIVETSSNRFTSYHTSIVLNLSWMNNMNTFLYFLLWMHRKASLKFDVIRGKNEEQDTETKIEPLSQNNNASSAMTSSQPDIEHGGVGCRDGSFLKRTSWWIRLFFCPMTKLVAERRAARSPEVRQEAPEPSGMSKHSIIKKFSNITHFFNPVLVIGSLHLTMMAGVGIWLWLSPLDFGSSNPSCTAQASFLILNRPISLASRRLQNASLVVYFLFVIPGLNIFLPMLLLGLIYVSFNTSRMYKGTHALTVWPLGFGLVILAVVNAIFILDIERSIKINSSIADSSTEQGWTFGQILPLVLLLIPLRDVVEILTNKRDHERLQDLDTALYNVLDGATGLFDLLDGGAGAPPLRRHGYAFATPLHFAANVDSLRLVKDCLSKYPNHFINDKDHNGMTPIGIAAKKGFTKIVEVLPKVELGAGAGEFGSPFRAALYMGNHDAAAKLQSPSVTGPTGVDNSDLEFFNEFTKNHNDWKIDGGIRGSSLGLRFAAAANDVEMMKVLLKEDADTNLIGPGPNIDQAFALGLASEKGYLGAVELLLENGADVNIGDDCALCSASDNGHPEVMRVLLRHGAYVNINSGSLLISASENGRLEVMRVLLDHGADVNINSGSLLISASKKGRLEVIRVLLEHGADVNKSSSPGGSALSLASENGHQEVVELLLENGADVNIFGASALRLAAFNRHFEVVALLVEKGADVMRFGPPVPQIAQKTIQSNVVAPL